MVSGRKRPEKLLGDRYMALKIVEKLFGTHSERELKRIMPLVDKIESLRPTMMDMTDEV